MQRLIAQRQGTVINDGSEQLNQCLVRLAVRQCLDKVRHGGFSELFQSADGTRFFSAGGVAISQHYLYSLFSRNRFSKRMDEPLLLL
jgi:hypothetical protein